MKIDILGGSYQQKYKEFNSQRTINWYPVVSTPDEKNRSDTALFPFPGLSLYTTLPGRYFRGLFVANTHNYNRCFAIVDKILYEILTNGTYTTIGTLPNISYGTNKIYITCNYNDEIGIFDYGSSYVYNMRTAALTEITTNQFPGSVTTADYLDGYTIISSGGATYFNVNGSLLTWTITNTFSPTFRAAPVIAVAAYKEDIYNFTSETIEPYINDGSSPFSRQPKSTIYIGLEAKDSLVTIEGGFLFLGRNIKGEVAVYLYDGNNDCEPLSNFPKTWQLNNTQSPLNDAYAYIQYTKDGHIFYFLTIPSLQTTHVYDVITKQWCERQSTQPYLDSDGYSIQKEFRGRHYTNFRGMNLYGDLYSGKVFLESFNSMLDDDQTIIRTRISETYSEEDKNISAFDLELEANTGYGTTTGQGVDPVLMLSTSYDGGYSYSAPRSIKMGSLGDHIHRARIRKLGTSRKWTLKLVLSDPIDLMMHNCVIRGSISSL